MSWLSAPWATAAVWLVARVCLVAMFPFSAADKVWHWRNSLAQTESSHMPAPRTMLVLAILVEAVTPVFIVAGVFDRPAALVLAGFCFVTAFLYHPFWIYSDLWSREDSSKGREHFWQFVKNFCIVGGLLLVVFAADLASPATVLHRPLSSTRPGAAPSSAHQGSFGPH